MKNKIITNSKYLTIGLIIGLSIIGAGTYAGLTGAGTLGSLFEKVGPSNYKLIGTNIKDESITNLQIERNTITNLQIERNTITEDTIIDDFKARDSDKLDGFDSTNFIKVGDAGDLIADNTIDTSEIENGTILEEDLSQGIKDKLVSKCILFGRTINHGFTITAYSTSSVPYGSNCSRQTRTCNNGVLSGNYAFQNCSVASPRKCTIGGRTINHGNNIRLKEGRLCGEQIRTCYNGVLNGNSHYNIYGACNPTDSISCNSSNLGKKYYFNNAKKCTRINTSKRKDYTHPTVFTGNYGEVPLDDGNSNGYSNVAEFCKKEIKRLGLGTYDGEYHYSRDLTKGAAYGKIVLSHRTRKPIFKGFVRPDGGIPRVTNQVFCYYYSSTYAFR